MPTPRLKSLEDLASIPEANEPLGHRESLFVQAYLAASGNGSEACRKLGYGGTRPELTAHEYLKRPRVQKAVQMAVEAMKKAEEPSIERMRQEYAKLAFRNYEGQFLAGHKLQAMKDLGNHLGMFKPENTVQVPVMINIMGGPELSGLSTDMGQGHGPVSVSISASTDAPNSMPDTTGTQGSDT